MPKRIGSACLLAALAAAGSTADAQAWTFQLPFQCGTTVLGQARTDHIPQPSIDFNGTGGGDTDLGMPVVAVGPGKVSISTYYTTNGYGNAIEITHPGGRRSFYAHLRDRAVGVNAQVSQGQVIGHVGKTSAKYTFTAHLHYEQRNASGQTVRARFDGADAPVYARMGQSVPMKSGNCGQGGGNPGGGNPGGGNPGQTPDRRRGVKLPRKIRTRRAATIQTDNGLPVSGRRAATSASKKVLELATGQTVRIVCQKRGQRVTGKFGTSRLWNLIDIGGGRGAYVTDTYVYTGSDGRVAPRCPRR